MKKLLLLFFSLLAFGYMFQACDNSKTYAEMLDEEKDAVNAFIKKYNIQTNNIVAVRFVEHDIKANDTTCFNVVLPGFENYPNYYTYPDVFRYVDNGTSVAGVFTEGSMYAKYGTTDVPPGWLLALKYVTNYAHVRMIVPSKMGHQSANQYVNPYFYDIRKFQKALN